MCIKTGVVLKTIKGLSFYKNEIICSEGFLIDICKTVFIACKKCDFAEISCIKVAAII